MAKIKITQIKSQIDRSKRQKDTIKALGLGKSTNPMFSNPMHRLKAC
jgi:ribosomal protein L30/L7E